MEKILVSTLYIVSTPIGNLNDITYRAVEILKNVDVILCEDTRRSRKLMTHYNIKTKLRSFHDYNEEKVLNEAINYLNIENMSVALISDAGTPLVSDPGHKLVKKCIDENIKVVPIVGASSILAALVTSNLSPYPFYFYGFFPRKKKSYESVLNGINKLLCTSVFFESPKRIKETLLIMYKFLGNRKITLARELTKKFETISYFELKDVDQMNFINKGEYVILVEEAKKNDKYSNKEVLKEYNKFIDMGVEHKKSMEIVSKELKISKKDVYRIVKILREDK